MSTNKKSFLIFIVLLLVTRLGDAVTTYICTPDLKYELNPIVRSLQWGWPGLILATTALTAGTIYLSYIYCMKQLNYSSLPSKHLESSLKFALYISYGSKGRFADFFLRVPKTSILVRMLGYAGGFTLVIFGIYCILNNVLFIFCTSKLAYYWVKFNLNSQVFHFLFTLSMLTLLSVRFYRKEYMKALLSMANEPSLPIKS